MILAAKRVISRSLMTEFSKGNGWIWTVAIAITVLVLFAILVQLKEWLRKRGLTESTPEQLLLEFRKAHQRGELSADEYKTIRERLFQKTGQAGDSDNSGSGSSAGDSAGSSQPNDD